MNNAAMNTRRLTFLALTLLGFAAGVLLAAPPSGYAGRPFQDAVHAGGPQRIPGAVFCAYYDTGGEGIAYHDTTAENQGNGKLNQGDGAYLKWGMQLTDTHT